MASQDDIYSHLCKCDKDFKPPLHTRVDIKNYANKIYEKAITFEAWTQDGLVGLVAAYLNSPSGYITNVSVLKCFEHRGIGSALLGMCLKKSTHENIKIMMLEVNKDDNRIIEMYRSFGFREFDQKRDSLMMKLNLDEN